MDGKYMYRGNTAMWANRLFLVTLYMLAGAVMFGLKSHYSAASADQLRWMLDPVAWIVRHVDGQAYAWEAGVGFVRWDRLIAIAPACAGVNYLIMVFGLTVAAFLHRRTSPAGRATWLALAGGGAYCLTVAVNAVRILVAVALYDAGATWGWLTAERLHLLAGTVVYFTALILYYRGLHRIIGRKHWADERCSSSPPDWLPWAWYLIGAVAVPTLHLLYRGRSWPGLEYVLTIVAASAAIWLLGSRPARK
jgi:exosortase K